MKKLTEKQKEMAQMLLGCMASSEIMSPTVQIGILCVLMKESGLVPKREASYANTSNDRIRKIFGGKKLGGWYNNDSGVLDSAKGKPKIFFDYIYRGVAGNGESNSGDGWNYRGGGLNQLTGRANYKSFSYDGVDLVKNPQLITRTDVAAHVAIEFFARKLKRMSKKELETMPKLYTRECILDAVPSGVLLAAHINAGLGKKVECKAVQNAYNNAMKYADVMTDEYIAYWCERMGTTA